MNITDAGITAVFGYVVVFAGLLILMIVISIMGAYFKSKEKATVKSAEPVQKQSSPNKIPKLKKVNRPVAKGSAGHVKLYDVSDKEAVMIMAIVADNMQKPINELRFISIKEVK